MADNKDEILLKLKIEENRALKKLKEVKESVNNLDRRTKKYKNTVREQVALESKLISVRKQRITLNKQMETSVKGLTKAQIQKKDATGSATSATMELSRVISDAPYGIRGMANNITQLVSQLGTASTKAGGLTGALKLMGKQLLGPLGIVFAITAVVSALDFFFGANKKAEESMDSFRVTASKTATDLKSLLIVMNEDMLSKEDLANVVGKVNEKYKDLNISIDEEGKLTKESRIQIDKKIKSMGKLALANAMMTEIEKKQSEIAKAAVEMQEDTSKDLEKLGLEDLETFKQRQDETEKAYIKRMNALGKHQEGYYKGEIDVDRVNRIARVRRQVKNFEETKERVEKQTKELLKISTTEGFFDSFFDSKNKETGKGDKKISPFKTPKELDIDIRNAENAIIQYEKKIEDARLKEEFNEKISTAKTEEEKEKIRRTYQRDRLLNQIKAEKLVLELKKKTEIENVKLKTSSHKADLKRIYDKYIFELSLNKKLSDEERKKLKDEATGKFGIANIQATGEENISIQEITDKYTPLFSLFQKLSDARLSALFSMPSKKGKKDDKAEEYDLEAGLNSYMELQQGLTSFMDGEFSRQITIEQNKTNAINNELRERLNNENLSAGERKNIQLQIARNDEALRKKQEKIEKKRFRMQKAANISQALIETYLAAAKALKTFGGVPTGLPAMSATIATGLLNVATIARQKFQSSAGATVPAGALGGRWWLR